MDVLPPNTPDHACISRQVQDECLLALVGLAPLSLHTALHTACCIWAHHMHTVASRAAYTLYKGALHAHPIPARRMHTL